MALAGSPQGRSTSRTRSDLEGGEELDVGVEYSQTESQLSCASPTITAAAITRQISRIEDPIVDMQIVTISNAPYKMLMNNVTGGPSGSTIFDKYTQSCVMLADGQFKCRHNFSISPGANCYASGNYTLSVKAATDGGCSFYNGTVRTIPFSIQTENMCSHDFDGVVDGF